jgi:DNA-binding NarL/FixJ family response regulator
MAVAFGQRPTVVLVDDHPGILTAVRKIVQKEFEVLAAMNDSGAAIDAIQNCRPDIVVLDIAMPHMNGFEAARCLRKAGLSAKVVFLTVTEDIDYARAAREIGASYIVKRRMHVDLIIAIKEALAGRPFYSPIPPDEVQPR